MGEFRETVRVGGRRSGRTLATLRSIAIAQREFAAASRFVTEAFDNLNEIMEQTKTEETPKDACPKHAKKPGYFWSSCPDCHIVRRKYHAELRQRGEHPEDALIQNATSKAIDDTRK